MSQPNAFGFLVCHQIVKASFGTCNSSFVGIFDKDGGSLLERIILLVLLVSEVGKETVESLSSVSTSRVARFLDLAAGLRLLALELSNGMLESLSSVPS